jgi:hypothetical protein
MSKVISNLIYSSHRLVLTFPDVCAESGPASSSPSARKASGAAPVAPSLTALDQEGRSDDVLN